MVLNKVPTGVQLYSSAIHVGCAKADHPIWVPLRCIGSIAVNRKKKDGEVCHFSRFSKISKHHGFLPSFWSTSASLKKYAVFWFWSLKYVNHFGKEAKILLAKQAFQLLADCPAARATNWGITFSPITSEPLVLGFLCKFLLFGKIDRL